nr:hypothetical protein [Tanacetum cinerariifolium]
MGARLGSMIAFRPRALGLFGTAGIDSTDVNNRQQQHALQPVTNVTRMSNEQSNSQRRPKRQAKFILSILSNVLKMFLDIKEHKQAAVGVVSLDDVYLDQIRVDFVLDSVKKVHHEGSLVFRIGDAVRIKDKFHILI